MGWRYYAQRILSGEWLDRDAQLRDVDITWDVSGPGAFTALAHHDLAQRLAGDGRLLFDEWSTALYAENDGVIRWGGLLRNSTQAPNGERALEFVGFAGYPHGLIFEGRSRFRNMDPFELVRLHWDYIQGRPDSNIGMVVDKTKSPTRIGGIEPKPKPVRGKDESAADYQDRLAQWRADNSANDEAYELFWWDTPDLGQEIDNLMAEAPGDYVEHHKWKNSDKNEVTHRLELKHPMIGERREDLRFVEGENLLVTPVPERRGDEFANNLIMIGHGSARFTLRVTAGRRDGRLRRDKVVTDKTIKNPKRLGVIAREEHRYAREFINLSEVVVTDHPNARLGSWKVGDEIRVQASSGWEDLDIWCRITSWSIRPSEGDVARLSLERAS